MKNAFIYYYEYTAMLFFNCLELYGNIQVKSSYSSKLVS